MGSPVSEACDSTTVTRFVLAAAVAAGADAARLTRESGLPGWALAADETMVPARHTLRLWELIEHATGVPHAGLAIAGHYQPGSLGLLDYLFATAATLRDGLETVRDFLHLATTNGRLEVEAGDGGGTGYSFRHVQMGGCGPQLGQQFAVGLLFTAARTATGRPIVPARVAFTQPAPRSHREFTEMFGTSRIEFDSPFPALTFRAGDLERPMRGADPALARILHRYAASLPAPPPVTWREHVQQQLAELIEDGVPSLGALARRLAVSTRTLQRQLAAQGTTWRAELEAARYRRAMRARRAGVSDPARLARELGYVDPGSARRALNRWDDRPQE